MTLPEGYCLMVYSTARDAYVFQTGEQETTRTTLDCPREDFMIPGGPVKIARREDIEAHAVVTPGGLDALLADLVAVYAPKYRQVLCDTPQLVAEHEALGARRVGDLVLVPEPTRLLIEPGV